MNKLKEADILKACECGHDRTVHVGLMEAARCTQCYCAKFVKRSDKLGRTKLSPKEKDILKACTDLLDAERIPWYRMNSGKIILRNGNGTRRCIKLNPEGTPDLLFHIRLSCHDEICQCYPSAVVWIETKVTGKSPTEAQIEFGEESVSRGEHWLLIDDVKQLQDWLKEMRK